MHAVRSEKNKHNMEMFPMTQKIHQKHCVLLTLLQSHCVCVCALVCTTVLLSSVESLSDLLLFFCYILHAICHFSRNFSLSQFVYAWNNKAFLATHFFLFCCSHIALRRLVRLLWLILLLLLLLCIAFGAVRRRRFIRRTDPKGNPTSIKYRCCCKFFNSLTHTDTELYRLEFDHKNDKNIIFFLLLPLLLLFVGSLVRSFVCSFICLLVLSFAFLDCNDVRNQN